MAGIYIDGKKVKGAFLAGQKVNAFLNSQLLFNEPIYLAVGNDTAGNVVIIKSADGITWQQVQHNIPAESVSAVFCFKNKFVINLANSTYVSWQAKQFNYRRFAYNEFMNLCDNYDIGVKYLVCATGGYIYGYSKDGVIWTQNNSSLIGRNLIYFAGKYRFDTPDGNSQKELTDLALNDVVASPQIINGIPIVCNFASGRKLLWLNSWNNPVYYTIEEEDGTLTQYQNTPVFYYGGVIYGFSGDRFWLSQTDHQFNTFYTSTDGINWTTVSLPLIKKWLIPFWDGEKYICMQDDEILVSYNGINFSQVSKTLTGVTWKGIVSNVIQ
ncbi:MAG: hypothetical protein LBR17_08400 [Bacteroidales bacterium]|jgi:hypothetical protein|nr:hypothetical protein [Bacteroidales bacterium]